MWGEYLAFFAERDPCANYPGHLATGVCFTVKIKEAGLLLSGKHYVICDPTYIGAPIGVTMPQMDNQEAKAILLE